jgi:hypothetical protein
MTYNILTQKKNSRLSIFGKEIRWAKKKIVWDLLADWSKFSAFCNSIVLNEISTSTWKKGKRYMEN